MSPYSSFRFVGINAASTVGRFLPTFYADKTGPLNMQIPFTFIVTVLCFDWITVENTAGLIVWSILYGFFCGCFASMTWPSVMSLTSDLQMMGGRMGIALGASGFSFLISSSVGYALLQSQGGLVSLHAWDGILLVISGFVRWQHGS